MEAIQNFFANLDFWTLLGYLTTAATLVSTIVAFGKAIKEKKFSKLKELMNEFIAQAETFKCKNGEGVDGSVKKEIVMGKLKIACGNFGINFNEEFWSNAIEAAVQFSKLVNKRDVKAIEEAAAQAEIAQ